MRFIAIALICALLLCLCAAQEAAAPEVQTDASVKIETTATTNATDAKHEVPTISKVISAYTDSAVDKSDLFIRNVPISDVESARAIADVIANTPQLRRFVLTKNGIANDADAEDLSGHVLKDAVVEELFNNGLSKQGAVRVLGLTKNAFESAKACAVVGSLLARPNNSVQKFYLYRNNIHRDCVAQLVHPFTQLSEPQADNKLFKLVVIDNDLGADGVRNVVSWLESPGAAITELILRNVKLDADAVSQLSDALASGKTKLSKLDLSENPELELDGFKRLAAALRKNANIVQLDIASVNMTSEDAVRELGELLAASPAIKRLDISDNNITDAGVRVLGEYLAKNTHLTKLDLSGTGISDAGVEMLTDLVEKNSTAITRLNLYRVEVTGEALKERIIKLDKIIKSDYFEPTDDEEEEDEEDEDEDEEEEDDEDDDDDDDEDDDEDDEEDEDEEEDVPEGELKQHGFFKKKTTVRDEL